MPNPRSTKEPPAEPIRVVVVEPRTLLGVGVREVLDQEIGIEVVAQVSSLSEALPIVDAAAPDVILVSEGGDSDETRRLQSKAPVAPLVVLGGDDNDASLVDALQLGATGHVAERAEPAELVEIIRRVADGDDQLKAELASRPDLVGRIVDDIRQALIEEQANPLTPRETEVLGLVGQGLRNTEIAARLGLSVQTVKNHLTAILHKLGVPNRTRAITYAVRHGWLVLGELAETESEDPEPDPSRRAGS